jgi:hypothetical protein
MYSNLSSVQIDEKKVNKYLEQRINIKFLFKLGEEREIEIFEVLNQLYEDGVMSRTYVLEWCERFSEGRDEVLFDSRPGVSTASKSDENAQMLTSRVQNDIHLMSE